MLYLVYATLLAWIFMVVYNYQSHKRYIVRNKVKFYDILEENYSNKGKIKIDDSVFFSFTPESIEKREFSKYLNLGKLKYILQDTTQIMFSVVLIFALAYSLEYVPFFKPDWEVIEKESVWHLILAGYVICLADAYSKTKKYDHVIRSWLKTKKQS